MKVSSLWKLLLILTIALLAGVIAAERGSTNAKKPNTDALSEGNIKKAADPFSAASSAEFGAIHTFDNGADA